MTRRTLTHTAASFFSTTIASLALVVPAQAQGAATSAQACVAIVLPSAKGIDGDATEFSKSLRDLFVSYLTGPSLRAIALDARLASLAIEEAGQKQCGHVLVTSITRKRDGGGGLAKTLGRAAGTAAWYGTPYGGTAAAAAARGAAMAGAQAIPTLADTTRAKDEVTLEFRLGTVDTAMQAATKTEKAKAKTDREDLLTPLVEKASEAIAAALVKK